MIVLDLSILNQKGTPMFYSDTLANRPAAGIVGRIFIAIDAPYGIYRDTGSAWDQISGASTFSGSLATGQVAFGSATNTISGTNNLFWNSANNRLGVNTNTPTTSLQVVGTVRGTNVSTPLVFSEGSDALILGTQGGTPAIGINATTRNVVIQNAGSYGDNGYRLQVTGDTYIKGSGTTSATNALLIQNNITAPLFFVENNGRTVARGTTNNSTDSIFTVQQQNGNTRFFVNAAGQSLISGDAYQLTDVLLRIDRNFNPTSGTATHTTLIAIPTINQTGGANGITRGVYVAPILTAAADWRSIEWSNNTGWGLYGAGTALNYLGGTLGIKTTSPYAPSTFSLDVNGGLLVKNTAGTTAQITLINADPSLGGNNGFLVASVGGTSGGSYVDFQGYYGTSVVGSTALRLNPAGGAVIVNSTTNSGEQFQLTGTIRVNGQTSGSAGGNSGQHLIINCDGTSYKIALLNP